MKKQGVNGGSVGTQLVTQPKPTPQNKVVRGNLPPGVLQQTAGGTTNMAKSSTNNRAKSFRFIAIAFVLLLLSVLVAGGVMAAQYMFGDLTEVSLNYQELGVNENVAQISQDQGVKNIALFGVDSRKAGAIEGRSDSIMVVSIDQQKNTIKLLSILRDSYVPIEGYGQDKITHAYAYGGPSLAIKTINEAFHLDIQDYVSIDFAGFASVVDAMGGVEMEITNAERKQINIYANRDGLSAPRIESPGVVTLDGAQATAYSRIRKIDGDDQRANRQQKVLTQLFKQLKDLPKSQYPSLVKTVMGYTETSLTIDQIMGFAPMILSDIELKGNAVPSEELDDPIGGVYDGQWVWRYDLERAAKRVHEFLYEQELQTEGAGSQSAS